MQMYIFMYFLCASMAHFAIAACWLGAYAESQAQSMAAKFNINSYLFGHELLNIPPQHAMALGLGKSEPRDFD